ncbi:hypothetical protein Tco_0365974 [Tanacetum coccineum]
MTKDKNPKPNPSSNPNNIPLKNKDKFPDLPSFAYVTNGIAEPIVDTSSTHSNIRALVLDDQDLINVEDPSMVLLVKLKDVNPMSNMYVIFRNEVDERMIWIEIRSLPLGACGSNAYKKVADMFGKFMFFEDEELMEMSSESLAKAILWNRIGDFMHQHADKFNSFIDNSGLIDLPLGGRLFTWMNKAETRGVSRSDHNPILLHVSKSDSTPTLFKLFHSSLLHDLFDEVIKTKLPKLEEHNFGRKLLSHEKKFPPQS